MLKGRSLLVIKGTCLSPSLYHLEKTGADILDRSLDSALNDLAPAIINGEAELTILDIPSSLIALQKFSGQIKIIGPISSHQLMGVVFDKSSQELLNEFNKFFKQCRENGTYKKLVEKFYPSVFLYFGDFFGRADK